MLEAIGLWNEPSNPAYWDLGHDPDFALFAELVGLAAWEIRDAAPHIVRVLGGVGANETGVLTTLLNDRGLREEIDVVGIHGFPYDWSHFAAEQWEDVHAACVRIAAPLPVWVNEAGASSWDSVHHQQQALHNTQAFLIDAERLYWYSLLDLPRDTAPYDYFGPDAGHVYGRHHHFGLFTPRGWPKCAVSELLPTTGVVQWFQYNDHETVRRAREIMHSLGIRKVRTGISWADWCRPNGRVWCDFLMEQLEEFAVFATLCFTPPSMARWPSTHNAACGTIPVDLGAYAHFARWVAERYG